MAPQNILVFIGVILSLICKTYGVCDKTPAGITGPRNRNDAGKYIIEIPGNPQNYTPLQKYNITLKISPHAIPQKSFRNFILTLQPAYSDNDDHPVGQFDLEYGTEMLTRFSIQCPNTVVESSVVQKTKIQVYWIAPPKDSGCVAIKATVVESKENWFSEDGALTKILCEESRENENVQPQVLRHCCACAEAKYEVAFEGKWTRNTHPRHFPSDLWNTKFSDVIGASHQFYHAFWKYEDIASEGLEELAENGVTKTLESELKNNSEHIRTIIKARGLQYPNTTKTTYAVFRVDNKNHLVSLASKIMPSPDWIIGVSNLELCKSDCTWEESRTLNLYPWDAGTDDGLGYTASIPVPPSEKRPIRRITPNNPNDPDSPFYDEDGEEIKPIAKLHLTRQRVYNKSCDNTNFDEYDCATTDWSEWSPCSVNCGIGEMYRKRTLVNEEEKDNCEVKLVEKKICYGQSRHCRIKDDDITSIEKSNTETEKETETEAPSTTSPQENDECEEGDENCEKDPNCPGNPWGPWSSCDNGFKTRFRPKKGGNDENDSEECPFRENVTCEVSRDSEGPNKLFGNLSSNNIVVSQGPVGRVVNCKVTGWSNWSQCRFEDENAICGQGYKSKTRRILRHPENGGNACPTKLIKFRECTIPCPSSDECIMSEWSNWTPCSSNCGGSAVQIRTRNILYKPPGVKCPAREEKKKCNLPLACTEDGKPIF